LPPSLIAESLSSLILSFVGETVGGASSFDFLLCLPLRGISGSFTPPFFFLGSLSLSYLDNYFLRLPWDYKEDYLLTPAVAPCKEEVSNALLDPPDPLEEIFLERTLETTLANLLEKVGFSPIYFV
jgi:hypothetical protein